MKIYVIRHGETQWNKEEVFRGRKDILLNETGQKQAEMVGLYLRDKGITRIVSSPLGRAVQTAEAISRTTGVPIERMEEFTDINFGIWEGLTLQKVEESYPADLAVWKTSPERFRVNGGETLATVRERIEDGLLKTAHVEEGSIAVVTHRVICKLLVLQCLKIGNEHFWDLRYDPASITLLEQSHKTCTLVFSNDTCHQREVPVSGGYKDF